ncbi:hypothetical protein OSB04_008767 [Centaurea solstitialis]|uniref:Uncharacterized protein n=1 Tax=Centaurea solstitialis TaxID=347529 RepID=A0AA38U5Q9_9ASTR|nr:hypothetical protein OSB04_008767 [Centaurea solstitialis]
MGMVNGSDFFLADSNFSHWAPILKISLNLGVKFGFLVLGIPNLGVDLGHYTISTNKYKKKKKQFHALIEVYYQNPPPSANNPPPVSYQNPPPSPANNPPPVSYQSPPPPASANPPPAVSYGYPPPAGTTPPPSGGTTTPPPSGGTTTPPPSGGTITPAPPTTPSHHVRTHHGLLHKGSTRHQVAVYSPVRSTPPPSTGYHNEPPSSGGSTPAPPSGTPTVPSSKPPVVEPPSPIASPNPSPPSGGCTCGTPTRPVVAPSPTDGNSPTPAPQSGYGYNPPPPSTSTSPSDTPSTTPATTPPSGTPPTTPRSNPPSIDTPSPPVDANIPFIGGTCNFWRQHPELLSNIFTWWRDTIGRVMGFGSFIPGFGTNMNFLEALSNERTDGYGALYREGTAAYLNSLVNVNFPFTTHHVRDSFVAGLTSNKAAAAQAEVFRLANEGHLRPRKVGKSACMKFFKAMCYDSLMSSGLRVRNGVGGNTRTPRRVQTSDRAIGFEDLLEC